MVGIDAAYFPEGAAGLDTDETTLFDGPPILAVEILSPSDVTRKTQAKVQDYLAAGVKLVWLIDPTFRTVTVYQPHADPEMFAGDEELSGDPHLPGLRIRVSSLFVE